MGRIYSKVPVWQESSKHCTETAQNAPKPPIPIANHALHEAITKWMTSLQCVIRTVAFSMGIDVPDIDFVIHLGSPDNNLSYWQQAGRCEQDGHSCTALLYRYPWSFILGGTAESMRELIDKAKNGESCLYHQILQELTLPQMGNTTSTNARAALCANPLSGLSDSYHDSVDLRLVPCVNWKANLPNCPPPPPPSRENAKRKGLSDI